MSKLPREQKIRLVWPCLLFLLAFSLWAGGGKDTLQALADSPRQVEPSSAAQTAIISRQSLFDAALKGDMKIVQTALKQGLDVNSADHDGRTALMFASYNGRTDIVRLLLDGGAVINGQDAAGRTALMYAASGPNLKSVQLLLDKKADPNIVDRPEKWTALMYAAAEGQTQVVQTLLRYGADKRRKDADGDTALDFAVKNNHPEVVRLLKGGS